MRERKERKKRRGKKRGEEKERERKRERERERGRMEGVAQKSEQGKGTPCPCNKKKILQELREVELYVLVRKGLNEARINEE